MTPSAASVLYMDEPEKKEQNIEMADMNSKRLLTGAAPRLLRVFSDVLGGGVYHYRDKEGQECDAVVHLRNDSYGLIEIKLGGDKLIEEGVKSLKAMASKIDTTKMKNPSFLMVLTGIGDCAYRRKDRVCGSDRMPEKLG